MRFVATTNLAGLAPLVVNGRPVLEDFGRIQKLVTKFAPQLFAQPVVTWGNGANPGSVAWYTEAEGEIGLLTALPTERREAVGERLRAALGSLWAERASPLIAAALTLANPAGVLAVGDAPVLIGWGLAPAERPEPADAAALAATFDPYVPRATTAIPPVSPPFAPPSSAPPPSQPATNMPGAAEASTAISARAATVEHRLPWLVPAGLAALALCIALGLWFGLRMSPEHASYATLGDPAALKGAIGVMQARTATLQSEIAEAQKTLAGNVCRLGAAGPAPALAAPVEPAALVPGKAAPFHGTLLALLRQATVMIAARTGPNGIVTGSGFFFAPGLVLTNRHVVAEAKGTIFVVSKKLTRPVPATLVTETPTSAFFHPDFAVLKVATDAEIQPLAFTPVATQLDQVVATGFPGAFLLEAGNQAYAQLEGLMGGDMANMPTMIATEGQISAIQRAPTGLLIMPHTAQISSGNSGGPLVDACGRVVGINTFTKNAAAQIVHINYAEKADSVLAFLHAHQVPVTVLNTPCAPAKAALPATPPIPTTQAKAGP